MFPHPFCLQQPARPLLARAILLAQPAHFFPQAYEPNPFFEITAFNISLSRVRSATNFFSRPFSQSTCRSRCAPPAFIPPHFTCHAFIHRVL
jgi:hypothetical protein